MALVDPLKKCGPLIWPGVIYHVRWVMFWLHHDMRVFLSQDQQCFMNTVTDCTLIVEDNLQAGCSIWKSVDLCMTCIMAFIGMNIQHLFVNARRFSFKLSSLTLFSYALQAHATSGVFMPSFGFHGYQRQLRRLGRGTLVLWPLCTMVGYKTNESCPLLAVYIQTQWNLCLHI
jgi:hypothetical protein